MTARLRPLSGLDQDRAASIDSYLGTFNRSAETRRTYESALRNVARLLDPSRDLWTLEWELIADAQLYDAVLEKVANAVAPSTATKYMSAVRGLVRHLARHGLAEGDALRVTLEGAPRLKVHTTRLLDMITTDELLALLRVSRREAKSAGGLRDAALIALLATTGARREEIANVGLKDIDRKNEVLTFTKVKGGDSRQTALHREASGYLDDWLEARGEGEGNLFCRVLKSGRVRPDVPIGGHAVWEIVTNRRNEAGISDTITPHSFRRWFVSSLLENGTDVFTASRLVGHRSPLTTQRYDKRGEETMRAAIQQLHIPTRAEADQEEEGADG